MKETLSELLEEFVSQGGTRMISDHPLRFEGDAGVENLNEVAKALGYKEYGYKYGSALETFLSDNPGAQEALLTWIGEQNTEEWKESIESELPEKEEDEDDEEEDE